MFAENEQNPETKAQHWERRNKTKLTWASIAHSFSLFNNVAFFWKDVLVEKKLACVEIFASEISWSSICIRLLASRITDSLQILVREFGGWFFFIFVSISKRVLLKLWPGSDCINGWDYSAWGWKCISSTRKIPSAFNLIKFIELSYRFTHSSPIFIQT